ncbi:MAG: type II toxin-antitoxin system HicA family toxin [bacterium]
MTKLPAVTGKQTLKALQKAERNIKSQKGSHVKLTKQGRDYFLIVPIHDKFTIPKGTLANIIKDAGLTVEEFVELM